MESSARAEANDTFSWLPKALKRFLSLGFRLVRASLGMSKLTINFHSNDPLRELKFNSQEEEENLIYRVIKLSRRFCKELLVSPSEQSRVVVASVATRRDVIRKLVQDE